MAKVTVSRKADTASRKVGMASSQAVIHSSRDTVLRCNGN